MVEIRSRLNPNESHWLNEHAAWPAAIVEDSGSLRGYLMRAAPAEYYFDFQTRTQGSIRKLAEIAFLLNPDKYVRGAGLNVTDQQRLALLKDIATTLAHLHALEAVVGDVSPKDILFSLSRSPDCFLINCDGIQQKGKTVLPQLETPDWQAPAGEAVGTIASDRYKFGLLAIRLFGRNLSSRDRTGLASISSELGILAETSQRGQTWERPSMDRWIAALNAIPLRTSGVCDTSASIVIAEGTVKSRNLVGHAFISYVREDSRQVDGLQRTLQDAGIPVWRDTTDLWPGEDWRANIRRAITDNALVFVACFSHASVARGKSYQNEELALAIEQMRLRRPDDPWLIPVRLDECRIPEWDIGGGRTLTSIQRVDLFGDRSGDGAARLAGAILRILQRHSGGETSGV